MKNRDDDEKDESSTNEECKHGEGQNATDRQPCEHGGGH
jgi:hypothetical protein